MQTTLARTPLFEWHRDHGGRMVDFAGWSMPVQYESIIREHQATRSAVTLFDVSHMGRLRFSGVGAESALDQLTSRSVHDLAPGQIRYSLLTNDRGGILDDVLVYRLESEDDYQLVVNAGNREKIVAWIDEHLSGKSDVTFRDQTLDTAMIAVQGPRAIELVNLLLPEVDLAAMKYYRGKATTLEVDGEKLPDVLISRTGYTGEDGCELVVSSDVAMRVWLGLLTQGAPLGIEAAGLGARDTLRLEAGMPLYGHELSEEINPFQAGLGFAVQMSARQFPGCEALARLADDKTLPRRVGLEIEGRRPAREGCSILAGEIKVGNVTSGTFSPTLQKCIAMGYLTPQAIENSGQLQVDIRGNRAAVRIVSLPFYKR